MEAFLGTVACVAWLVATYAWCRARDERAALRERVTRA